MLQLIIIDDEGRKTPVPLTRDEITLGRGEGNTIRLTERNVSRHHARIYRNGDGYRVEDLSRYGVRKNGRRIEADSGFEPGDVLLLGDYRLTLLDENAQAHHAEGFEDTNELDQGAVDARRRALAEADARSSTPEPTPAEADTQVANHARLLCLSEPFVGSEFVFRADVLVIGTASDCDLIIDHASIAEQHARFVRDDEGYRVAALAANLVVLQNDSAPGELLAANDVVRVGDLRFRFLAPGAAVQHVPLDAFDEAERRRGGPPLVVVALSALVVVLAVAVIALALRGGGAETDETPVSAEQEAQSEVPAVEAEPELSAAATLLDEGRAHLEAAEWDEAAARFGEVPANAPERQTADALQERAERELALVPVMALARDELEAESWAAALDRLDEIAPGTWHGQQVEAEGLRRRALDGFVNDALAASREAQEADDLSAALSVVEAAGQRAPQERALVNRIEQLRALERAREAQREEQARAAAASRRPATPARAPAPPAPAAEPAPAPEPEELVNRRERASLLRQQAAREGVQQNFQDAIRLLESARELNPGDPQIDLMLFSNYRQIGNRSRASRAVQRYLQARPNDPRREEYEEWLEENAP